MFKKSYIAAVIATLLTQVSMAAIFDLGPTKRELDGFPIVEWARTNGRHGQYTLKDFAAGEVQVKIFGGWKKALNAQILLLNPKPFGGDVNKAVKIIGEAKGAGLRLRAVLAAPSSMLADSFEKAKRRFPELNTPKREMDQLIAEIRKHGGRTVHEINLFVERDSSTIFAEYSSRSGSNVQTTTAEIDASEEFFRNLIGLWASEGGQSESKMRIIFK